MGSLKYCWILEFKKTRHINKKKKKKKNTKRKLPELQMS